MREDANAIAADLDDLNPLADDGNRVVAVMLSVIDNACDMVMTLSDDFTVARADRLIDEHGLDVDQVCEDAYNQARNLTPGHHVITRFDDEYHPGLLRMEHPPNILYASGDLSLLDLSLVAVVGSRTLTPEQEETVSEVAILAGDIVSGLAPGTDEIAMRTALGEGRSVVGVVATGVNYPFGPHSADLARQVSREGLLLSEYPLGTGATKERLLRRNEIIAGLSDTFVACAAQFKSGTYSGVRRAEKMGLPILALPGTPALDDWLVRNPNREVDEGFVSKLDSDRESYAQ